MTLTLRVMTWNVHGTFKVNPRFDIDAVSSIIRKWSPDIVGLQEIDSRGRKDNLFSVLPVSRACITSMPDRSSQRMAITDRFC
jgi:endonuclease/exonuclease/phosphatase family metal-dependent hydrolase